MNTHSRYLAFILPGLCAAGGALADPVVCQQGALTRSIDVVYANPGQPVPCEVLYDKSAEGTLETLWRATSEAGYCEAKAAGLVEKLSGLGWRCGPVDTSAEGPMEQLGDVDEPVGEPVDGPVDGPR